MGVLEFVGGLLIVMGTLMDLFKAVILPRPTRGRFRVSRILVRQGWRLWRWTGLRFRTTERRESFLGSYGPFGVIAILVVGVVGLAIGYGLMLESVSSELRPVPSSFGTTLYFSAITLLTLGFGDYVPAAAGARLIVVTEAATGLGVVALIISFLFSLYGSFQRREVAVVTLESVAGAPPSGMAILDSHARLGIVDLLSTLFAEWKQWSAEVLESHLAYPVLIFFRSSHDNQSWVSALGAVLDAATLVVTTIEDVPRGPAKLMLQVGGHLVEDLARQADMANDGDPGIEEFEFDQARARLEKAGYRLTDRQSAWTAFRHIRSAYAGYLNTLARNLATPPAQWIGDRSPVHLRDHHQNPSPLRGGG